MTTSEIIACVISITAAIVSITAYVAVRRAQRPRYDVQWPTNDGMLTARGLTRAEFDALMARLKSEEEPGA